MNSYYCPQGYTHRHTLLINALPVHRLINKLQPGSVAKINTGKMAFKLMENISNFLDAATRYGVAKTDLFQTVDLYEAENIPQVQLPLP